MKWFIVIMLMVVIVKVESGLIFYWISWMLWVIITFFMEKTNQRLILASWILLILIGSNVYIELFTYSISIAFIFLFIGTLLLTTQSKRLYYSVFSSFTIMIGYIAILIWEKVTPVWFIFPRELFIPFFIFVLLTLFSKRFYHRLAIGLLGVSFAEIFYFFILSDGYVSSIIGKKEFFDHIAILIIFLLLSSLLQSVKQRQKRVTII